MTERRNESAVRKRHTGKITGAEGRRVRDRRYYKEMGREGCRGIYEKTARGRKTV